MSGNGCGCSGAAPVSGGPMGLINLKEGQLSKPLDTGPNYWLWGGITVVAAGLFYLTIRKPKRRSRR